jgi:hypothetical protein
MPSKRHSGANCDLDEIRPHIFIVYNPALRPLLRGEGDLVGDRFTLTGQRREGLLARLRTRTFVVHSIDALIAVLPPLPEVAAPGAALARTLTAGERYSAFAAMPEGWAHLSAEPDQVPPRLLLRVGWAVRRRRGRNAPEYFLVAARNGLADLQPIGEGRALLHGYAQITLAGPQELVALPAEGGLLLPDLPLPAAHTALMRRIGDKTKQGWQVSAAGLPFAADLLATLGLVIQRRDAESAKI